MKIAPVQLRLGARTHPFNPFSKFADSYLQSTAREQVKH
jgi:hypothetical protein